MKKVLIGLVVLLGGFSAFVTTRPDDYKVERSATMAAPPELVFAQVSDFHNWGAWSPWEKLDPTMKKDYSGADKGVGASYHWVGNDKVGEGRMTITDATASSQVGIKLEFMKPFESTSTTTFTLAPVAEGTKFTWSMAGKNNFVSKAMGVFASMDSMIGKDFESGLANLKGVVEPMAKEQAEAAKKAAEAAAAAAPAPEAAPAPVAQ
ncbi:MAG: SRPBCC family protein [Myxococcaceae bacterium]|nr:SRPBCC family protein [Myxococcaceae bacterium]